MKKPAKKPKAKTKPPAKLVKTIKRIAPVRLRPRNLGRQVEW